MCPDFVTCSNRLNCNWKWALVLTLYNTIAWKCYPCTSSVACLPSLPVTYQPTHIVPMKLESYASNALTEFFKDKGVSTVMHRYGSHVHAIYSTLLSSVPTQTPSVHLQVQSSDVTSCGYLQHRHFAVLTGCMLGTLNISLEQAVWNIMHKWPTSTHLCTVHSKLGASITMYFGVQHECFVCAMWYTLMCKMNFCT